MGISYRVFPSSFANDFEETKSNIYDSLTEEQIDFIELLHEIYLQITRIGILGEGNESVSTAMIKKYDKHGYKSIIAIKGEKWEIIFHLQLFLKNCQC